MKQWEYNSISSMPYTNISADDINKLGEKGWEMCGIIYTTKCNMQIAYFKREVVGVP